MVNTSSNNKSIEELIEFSFINIDKPAGPTSHDTTHMVKKILGIKKAGHTGTLDPKVTGCLVIGLNKATRLTEYFLKGGKEYEGTMLLHQDVTRKELDKVIKQFIGIISQLVPKKSAVKRQKRERAIYSFKILQIEKRVVTYRVACEAGTYIRKLCHDVGEALGSGAHMTSLRRTKVAHLTEESMVSLDELKKAVNEWKKGDDQKLKAMLIPAEEALKHMKKVRINEKAIQYIKHGMRPKNKDLVYKDKKLAKGDNVAIFSHDGCLLGIAKLQKEATTLKDKQDMSIKMEKVFI